MSNENINVGPFNIKNYWKVTRLESESYRAWLRRAAAGKVANVEAFERRPFIDIKAEAVETMKRKHMAKVSK